MTINNISAIIEHTFDKGNDQEIMRDLKREARKDWTIAKKDGKRYAMEDSFNSYILARSLLY